MAQAQAYIEEQNGIIDKLRQKMEQVKEYLMAFNAMEHFMGWVMQFRQPVQEVILSAA